ncbi:MAG: DUF5691 domain-containing protein [Chloroflexota bacterium]
MTTAKDLVTLAIVGLDQAPAASATRALGEGSTNGGQAPPERLLDLLALHAHRARVAQRPLHVSHAQPTPAPGETRQTWFPPPSLLELIGRAGPQVAPELTTLFTLMAEREVLLPPSLIPPVLSACGNIRSLRGPLGQVVGERGRWLAQLNTAWRWLLARDRDEETWNDATTGIRADWLTSLRGADPEQARHRLLQVWPNENSADRAMLVATLATGLSIADEPDLERLLDDRSEVVRTEVATLLASIDGSRLAARERERARAWIRVERSVWRKVALSFSLPRSRDNELARDGYAATRGKAGVGAAMLTQCLQRLPPPWFEAEWNAPAATILDWALESEFADVFKPGWLSAATTFRSAKWLELLLERTDLHGLLALVPAALHIVPADRRGPLLLQIAERFNPEELTDLALTLDGSGPPLDATTSRSLAAIANRINTDGRARSGTATLTASRLGRAIARHGPINILAELLETLHSNAEPDDSFNSPAAIARRRIEMHEELSA